MKDLTDKISERIKNESVDTSNLDRDLDQRIRKNYDEALSRPEPTKPPIPVIAEFVVEPAPNYAAQHPVYHARASESLLGQLEALRDQHVWMSVAHKEMDIALSSSSYKSVVDQVSKANSSLKLALQLLEDQPEHIRHLGESAKYFMDCVENLGRIRSTYAISLGIPEKHNLVKQVVERSSQIELNLISIMEQVSKPR